METADTSKPATKPHTVKHRIVWFLVGAVVNYLLIASPFKYLTQHTQLAVWQKSAMSMAVSATFFFFWNYFINFRTDSRKRDAFPRYLAAVVILWAISSALLTAFKQFDAKLSVNVGKFSPDLDVVTLQLCFGWLKFIVYHKWAFPAAKAPTP